MIFPAIAAIVIGAVVRYAVKEGIEYVVDKAKDAAVEALMKKGREYAEKMLIDKAREQCPTCKPEDVIKSMTDPCAMLSRGKGAGKYRGGSHEQMTKPAGDGLDSHHAPAKSNYPSWRVPEKTYDKWPAIQMESSDHKDTFSYGRGALSRAYARAQQYAFKEYGMMAAFALDVAEIKMKFGSKYDQALTEAAAYGACVSAFPEKYDTRSNNGRSRRRR